MLVIFAVVYCSPQFSSQWEDEIKRWGAYPTSKPHNDPSHFTGRRKPIPAREHNPYVEAFWEWWPSLYPKLKHFRMTGGEPLLDRNTFKVFDYVLALPNPELHLDVTSNFSVDNKVYRQYHDYVKRLCNTNIEHFMQYVSLDYGSTCTCRIYTAWFTFCTGAMKMSIGSLMISPIEIV